MKKNTLFTFFVLGILMSVPMVSSAQTVSIKKGEDNRPVLYLVDGKEVPDMESVDTKKIYSIEVLKNGSKQRKAIDPEGKYSNVVVITTRQQEVKSYTITPEGDIVRRFSFQKKSSGPSLAIDPLSVPPVFNNDTWPNAFPRWVVEHYGMTKEEIKAALANLSGIDEDKPIVAKFTVEADGSVKTVVIRNKLSLELDTKAQNVLLASSGMWKPGYIDGKAVPVTYLIQFIFDRRSNEVFVKKPVRMRKIEVHKAEKGVCISWDRRDEDGDNPRYIVVRREEFTNNASDKVINSVAVNGNFFIDEKGTDRDEYFVYEAFHGYGTGWTINDYCSVIKTQKAAADK